MNLESSSPSVTRSRERLHVPRIRSHSLAPKHSKYDYNRRRSELEQSTVIVQKKLLDGNKPSPQQQQQQQQKNVPTWFRRRFTLFSVDSNHLQNSGSRLSNYSKQNSFSFDNDQILEKYNQQRRPSKIMSLVESFVRKFSLRKKKSDPDEDAEYVDPVYETLKLAAETRKMTLSNYLQQRQQTLNKQTSLNSQGSSEHPSPKNSRNSSRTEMDIVSTTTKNVTTSSSGMNDDILPGLLSSSSYKNTNANRILPQRENVAIRHHLTRQLSLQTPHNRRGDRDTQTLSETPSPTPSLVKIDKIISNIKQEF
ncbi:unnamed protein product [Didymodactylos carnosus]|uniref:Uncharacterized protein n=1 Tax=Didymodactylos carnosus TaxID=1234261 RepID=A0A8S2DZE1_9BILA|nr:unnamed protein product [Didymodactylos carnosus]CAF3853877.1 unnamed protein product [Didymodactylos carnosus]